jgi:hypothetical protein
MRRSSSSRSAKESTGQPHSPRTFLERELRTSATSAEISFLEAALLAAGDRYDRYARDKQRWLRYRPRKARLKRIVTLAIELADNLSDLDILSRDDLAGRFGSKEIDSLPGSLLRLWKEAGALAEQVQPSGRPRDLAEERWILELADIYENTFAEKPRISGSGSEQAKRRGRFYDFLMVSRPREFPRHGKLSLRQVHRALEKRTPKPFAAIQAALRE